MTRKAGQQLSQAGASPLRASIGEQLAVQQADTVKREAEAQALANAEAKAEAERKVAAADAKAKEELGTAETTAMPSSNPPPPNPVIPKPAPTPTADAFQAALAAEDAAYNEQQALEAAEAAARKAREAAVTGIAPAISVEISMTETGPIQAPASAAAPAPAPTPGRKTFFGNMAAVSGMHRSPASAGERHHSVQELPLSDFTRWGRFWNWVRANKWAAFKISLACMAGLVIAGCLTVGLLSYFAVTPADLDALAHTSADSTDGTTEPVAPTVTTVIRAPEPVVEPAPEPFVAPTLAEPGVTGRRGHRAMMSAREAFPTSCATAWDVRRTDGVTFLCSPGERSGNDVCNCRAVRFIP